MPHRARRRARYELLVWFAVVCSTSVLFWCTDLDYRVAQMFYQAGPAAQHWPYQQLQPVKILYDYAFPFCVVVGLSLLSISILGHWHAYTRRYRRKALYILLVILLGPGLVVNLIFKDHWGRPRPVHVQEFGGQYAYVPPLKPGNTPDKSFVCGHCSVGYAFFVLYFLSQSHKVMYFVLTLALAWTLGITRMTAGGHFLSDVLWSGYVMFLVAHALYYGWFLRIKPEGGH